MELIGAIVGDGDGGLAGFSSGNGIAGGEAEGFIGELGKSQSGDGASDGLGVGSEVGEAVGVSPKNRKGVAVLF